MSLVRIWKHHCGHPRFDSEFLQMINFRKFAHFRNGFSASDILRNCIIDCSHFRVKFMLLILFIQNGTLWGKHKPIFWSNLINPIYYASLIFPCNPIIVLWQSNSAITRHFLRCYINNITALCYNTGLFFV